MAYDVAVIGAGVSGCLTARELSKYKLKTALIEKFNDVAMATTKANSGIVHAGYDAEPGTLKAKLNVKGCSQMAELCSTLYVAYKNTGSLVLAFSEDEMKTLQKLYDRGVQNGVTGMKIIGKDEILKMEPNVSKEVFGALYSETAGIVSPYELAIAGAECAVSNGVEYYRNFDVKSIVYSGDMFTITCGCGKTIEAKYIINCAGVHADKIAGMIGDDSIHIVGRLGEYGLLDKSVGDIVNHVIFQCPNEMGKGILVAPTAHGNILVGPTSVDVEDTDSNAVRASALNEVFEKGRKSVPSVSMGSMITSFAGVRAHDTSRDFVISPSKANHCFINCGGIESPGLASSPAIAEYVAGVLFNEMGGTPEKNDSFNPSRKEPVHFSEMSNEEREKLISENPAYARIICRCETVTEGEIIDSIKAPAGARDVDGVKRRTRAGMGRCQGGFCGSKVMDILSRELDKPINEITKFGENSDIIYERTK